MNESPFKVFIERRQRASPNVIDTFYFLLKMSNVFLKIEFFYFFVLHIQ